MSDINQRCDKYLGDNDATCPQLTCMRSKGHPDDCDNTVGDRQVWALDPAGLGKAGHERCEAFPVSLVYERIADASRVLAVAQRQLSSFTVFIASSEAGHFCDYEVPVKHRVSHEDAIELFRRLGW